jgi:myo-inositol-1(or 4)-monophosphatase
MTDEEVAARYDFACALAEEAGAVARHYFRAPERLHIAEKGPRDIVTAADLAVDALIRRRIAETFPGDAILTEEAGGVVTDRLWIVDPIDGTQNFAHGVAHFAVSIAFRADGETLCGAVIDPAAGELFSAKRGGGAFCDGRRLKVSGATRPEDAVIDAGYSHRLPMDDYLGLLGRIVRAGFDFSQMGSAALGLAHVACGRIDGYCELHLWSWDVLAGLLLVEEAGGRVNDFAANDGLRRGNPVVACAPGIAASLREAAGID